jgi:glutamyl-Q tRNA(Asp) synthetase
VEPELDVLRTDVRAAHGRIHQRGGARHAQDGRLRRHRGRPLNATAPVPRRGRFAPSPTGPLHFGSLLAALASYCDAKQAGAQWLVRIEDVDEPRTRTGAEDEILATLSQYGFAWDGPVLRQSERTAQYETALARLVAAGHAYPCACTRRELEAAPLGPGGEHVYPGTCRAGIPPGRVARAQRSWRVRVGAGEGTGAATIAFRDRLQGPQQQDLARDVGDFVVKRADGLFAYQLAVVVDDALQGITDVVRGADLLSSTPRQIHLQRLLGLATPSYLHIPIAINADGEKLSKQTRAAPLPPQALPALLAAWRFLDQAPLDAGVAYADVADFWRDALARWAPARLPPVFMLPVPPGFRGVEPAPV